MTDHTPAALFGAAVGRVALAGGLLLLSFAGYQLWGTGLSEARAQASLAGELAAHRDQLASPHRTPAAWPDGEPGLTESGPDDAALVRAEPRPALTSLVEPVVGPRPAHEPLEVGRPFATLRIPTIGVDKTVVEGTTREALRTGPGHYLGTARPGQRGNVGIAGHRTTYGAPFHDIDQLRPGDPIVVETEAGSFTYRIEGQPTGDGGTIGHVIVAPEDVDVIADKGDHRLTLTACHPRYSASQRIVVTAVLDDPPAGRTVPAEPAPDRGEADQGESDRETTVAPMGAGQRPWSEPILGPTMPPAGAELDDLGWNRASAGPTMAWAALTAIVVGVAWLVGRLWRRLPAYLMAGPSFTLCLVTCFGHLDRLIPAA